MLDESHTCCNTLHTRIERAQTFPIAMWYVWIRLMESKHILNAQVAIRAPCCRKFFDVRAVH